MRRRLALLLLAAAVASSCELLGDATVNEALSDVRRQTGVDFRDPSSVAQAATGANLIGNKDAENGVDAVKGFQRADHEQKGDALRTQSQYGKARAEYQEALRWTREEEIDVPFIGKQSRTPDPTYVAQLKEKRAGLYDRVASTYAAEANTASERGLSPAEVRKTWRLAADNYDQAANESSVRAVQARAHTDAGFSRYNIGDYSGACAALKRSEAVGGSGVSEFLRDTLRAKGQTCQ